jgi:hypothetical protein
MASQDYYSDAAAPAATAPKSKESAEPKEGESDNQTAELPKAVLGGKEFKPGEEVVLQVVQVMEDSVLVKYASAEPEEKEEEPPSAPPPQAAPGGGGGPMSSMLG